MSGARVGGRLLDRHVPALVALAAVAAFVPALWAGFVMDDWPVIVENRYLAGISLAEIFGKGTWASTGFTTEGDHYRPVFVAWFSLIRRLAGLEAAWFHASAIAWHAANTLLVWLLATRLAIPGAVIAALLFAVHPVHVQNVAWISAHADLLVAFFSLAAGVLWLAWREHGGALRLAAVLAACVLAAFSKETGLLVPVLLGLLHWCRPSGTGPLASRHAFAALALCLAAPLAALIARAFVLGTRGVEAGVRLSPDAFAWLADALGYVFQGGVFGYPQPYHFKPMLWAFSGPLVLPALLLVAFAAWAVPRRTAVLCLAWVLVSAAPGLLLAMNPNAAFATRLLYLPSVGFVLLAGAALAAIPRPGLSAGVTAAVAAGFAVLVLAHLPDWRDDESFYGLVVRSNPREPAGYEGQARHYGRQGDAIRQERTLIQGIAAVGDAAKGAALFEELGFLHVKQRRHADAEKMFRALAERPERVPRVAGLVALGNLAWTTGDVSAAVRYYREVLAIDPGNRTARTNLHNLQRQLSR